MKNKFSKLISALLIFAFLISAFSVFAFAEEGEETEEEVYTVYLNRTFEEGWNYTNGLLNDSSVGGNFTVDYEEDEEYRYNYFLRAEVAELAADTTYFNFSTYVAREGKTVVEFSIKADDVATLGRIIYLTTGVHTDTINLFSIDDNGHLIAFPSFAASSHLAAEKNLCHSDGLTDGYCDQCKFCNHSSTVVSEDGTHKICKGCGANFAIDLGLLENEWLDIALVFDWGVPSDGKPLDCDLYWGEEYENTINVSFPYEVANDKGMKTIRFGFPKQADETGIGKSFCIDNLKVYQGEKLSGITELDPQVYGEMVNVNEEKTVNIQQGAGFKDKAQLLEDSLCLKLGVNYALLKNNRRPVYDGTYGAPVKYGDNVMISLDLLLEYIGYPFYRHPDGESYDITTGTSATYITAGRDSATVAGERIELSVAPTYFTSPDGQNRYLTIAVADIEALFPGYLTVFDDMGLIIVYEDITPDNLEDNENFISRAEDLEVMVDLMKKFIFDTEKAETTDGTYAATAQKIIEDVKENTSLSHPYIIADQETFDKLSGVYSGAEASAAKAYLASLVAQADAFYNEVANVVGGAYAGIANGKAPVNPYTDGALPNTSDPNDTTKPDTTDGYDPYGGRLVEGGEFAEKLVTLAFAYQITKDDKYAKLAYDWAKALTEWSHWGPGYFVDCAETASSFAIAYDWLYNAYVSLGYSTDVIADGLFQLAIHEGYISANRGMCEHPRSLGDESIYSDSSDNTNVISTSGMVISILATIGYTDTDAAMKKEAEYVLGHNIVNLINNGLIEYAPDGSYIESATYWELATNALVKMIMTLDSAANDDFGFLDTWGLDKTCYYAAHIESSDGFIWNYNDAQGDGATSGNLASLDTAMFTYIGTALGDDRIVAFRQNQLESGKKQVSIYDMLFYPFGGVNANGDLPLDYYMDGIQGFVSRSDWNDGAIYTGIMGGSNTGNHAQIDSGNFIYYNKGINWFLDLGGENESVSLYNGANRYKYYRATSEGQNVILISSATAALKYGQITNAGGTVVETYSDEFGSYAIINNHSVYGGNANTAYRGLFLTNDRKTVVVQDEMAFKLFETVYWVAHTAEEIYVDGTGKIAYLTATSPDGNTYVLRATLVSEYDFSFTVYDDKSAMILPATQVSSNIGKGGTTEHSRTGLKRLVIESKERISFNVAVVFEIVENYDGAEPVGYKWTDMDLWKPYSADEFDAQESVVKRGNPKASDIKTYTANAQSLFKRDTAFTSSFDDIFSALTKVGYTVTIFDPDTLSEPALINAYDDYKKCVKDYNKYLKYVDEITANMNNLADKLLGFSVEVVVEEE